MGREEGEKERKREGGKGRERERKRGREGEGGGREREGGRKGRERERKKGGRKRERGRKKESACFFYCDKMMSSCVLNGFDKHSMNTDRLHSTYALVLNDVAGFCPLLNQQDRLNGALVNQSIQDVWVSNIHHVQHSRV